MTRYPDSNQLETWLTGLTDDANAMLRLQRHHDSGTYGEDVLWAAIFAVIEAGFVAAQDVVSILHDEWLHREHIGEDR